MRFTEIGMHDGVAGLLLSIDQRAAQWRGDLYIVKPDGIYRIRDFGFAQSVVSEKLADIRAHWVIAVRERLYFGAVDPVDPPPNLNLRLWECEN